MANVKNAEPPTPHTIHSKSVMLLLLFPKRTFQRNERNYFGKRSSISSLRTAMKSMRIKNYATSSLMTVLSLI